MKFYELKIGDKFISEPLPRDISNKAYFLFIKTGKNKAIKIQDGIESSIPDEMLITRIRR